MGRGRGWGEGEDGERERMGSVWHGKAIRPRDKSRQSRLPSQTEGRGAQTQTRPRAERQVTKIWISVENHPRPGNIFNLDQKTGQGGGGGAHMKFPSHFVTYGLNVQ